MCLRVRRRLSASECGEGFIQILKLRLEPLCIAYYLEIGHALNFATNCTTLNYCSYDHFHSVFTCKGFCLEFKQYIITRGLVTGVKQISLNFFLSIKSPFLK